MFLARYILGFVALAVVLAAEVLWLRGAAAVILGVIAFQSILSWWQGKQREVDATTEGSVVLLREPHFVVSQPADAQTTGADTERVPAHIALPKVRKPSPVRTNKGPYLAHDVTVDVLLNYRDGTDRVTERLITVRQLMGTLHRDRTLTLDQMVAFCHLRRNGRTFLFCRVVRAADPKTGELIQDFPAWMARACGRMERVRGVTADAWG